MLDKIAQSDNADMLAEVRALRAEQRANFAALRELIEARLGAAPVDDDALSVPVAARICKKSEQTLRNWAPHIAHFDPRARRYVISRARLKAYLQQRFGCVPPELD